MRINISALSTLTPPRPREHGCGAVLNGRRQGSQRWQAPRGAAAAIYVYTNALHSL